MSKLALLTATLLGAAMLAAAGCAGGEAARVESNKSALADFRARHAGAHADPDLELRLAAATNDPAEVAAALKRGGNPNAPDEKGETAIFKAWSTVKQEDPNVMRLLLEAGADPLIENNEGHSVYKWVSKSTSGHPATRRMILTPENSARLAGVRRRAAPASAPAVLTTSNINDLAAMAAAARQRRDAPGNTDDAAYDRMRAAAGMAPEKRGPVSDVDSPSRKSAERPDDFALVVGVEGYQSLPKADHGERDAKTVRKHLEALGFPARNIVSLEGSGATKSKLESYLKEWLPLNVKPSSTLFVYYSGHGAPDPKSGDAYLVPWDGDPKFLKSTAYPLKSLYADLSKTKAKRVIVALDACFSGAGGRSVLAQGARPLVAKVAELAAGDRLTVLAAASGDEITGTLEEQGHGMFTYHLLKGLSADPKASAKSLHGYLLPRVQDDARRQNREQTPTLAGASLDAPLLP
jgi:hypothetical protein